jgi:hypothetical protein
MKCGRLMGWCPSLLRTVQEVIQSRNRYYRRACLTVVKGLSLDVRCTWSIIISGLVCAASA